MRKPWSQSSGKRKGLWWESFVEKVGFKLRVKERGSYGCRERRFNRDSRNDSVGNDCWAQEKTVKRNQEVASYRNTQQWPSRLWCQQVTTTTGLRTTKTFRRLSALNRTLCSSCQHATNSSHRRVVAILSTRCCAQSGPNSSDNTRSKV